MMPTPRLLLQLRGPRRANPKIKPTAQNYKPELHPEAPHPNPLRAKRGEGKANTLAPLGERVAPAGFAG
jgi:hypothetical protein